MAETPSEAVPRRYPVSVVLERRIARSGPWEEVQWDVVGVVVGEDVAARRARVLVHEDGEERRYLYTGLSLELFKDGCEGYWYNLMSGKPYLFVVCHSLDDEAESQTELTPVHVTANQDEASGHMETDEPVFSVAMPEAIHDWVERFVLDNYEPEIKKKRKRRDWSQEADDAQRTRTENRRLH